MRSMRLSTKLIIAFLVMGIVPFAVMGGVSLVKSGNALETQAYNQLVSMREVKKNQIESFFQERQGDMQVLLNTVEKVQTEAMNKLSSVQELKKSQLEQYIAKVRNDITVLSKSEDVLRAYNGLKAYHDDRGFGHDSAYDTDTEQYERLWRTASQSLGKYVQEFGYYDVFVVCKPHGHVMFSQAQEDDLGANLGSGKYKDQGLARLWQKVMEQEAIVIEDFSAYAPSGGEQAAFAGGPVYNETGELVGMVALQLPKDQINGIIQQRQGLGETGETYLAAEENGRVTFRSAMQTMGDGKFVIGYDITDILPDYVQEVLDGETVRSVYTDSSGSPVMVAGSMVEIGSGIEWAMVSKQNLNEAMSGQHQGGDDYFSEYIQEYGYYDLFLVNPQGHVFYTVAQESDYQTNMFNGKYADSNLGKLLQKVEQTHQYAMADFAPYAPSNNEPSAFIAQPLIHDGKTELVVALQVSLDAITAIMQQRAGMGETGETYLVGEDKLMRSDSFLDPENHSVAAWTPSRWIRPLPDSLGPRSSLTIPEAPCFPRTHRCRWASTRGPCWPKSMRVRPLQRFRACNGSWA